jgi:hypothetical protein
MQRKNIYPQYLISQEVIKTKAILDRGVHFPDVEVLDHNLANEIGLSPNNQTVHWNVYIARILNHFLILALQYRQIGAKSELKTDLLQMTGRRPFENFKEFASNIKREEKLRDVPDTIWTS